MPYQGTSLLNEEWPSFLDSLNNHLKESGFEAENSSLELMVFSFPNTHAALTAILGSINKLKGEFKQISTDVKLPVQYVLHIVQPKEPMPGVFTHDSVDWEMLQPETIYITRALKSQLEILMARQQLPACTMKNEGKGLFELQFTGNTGFQTQRILAFRKLPVQGPNKPCFYCGMKSHKPSGCPSKFLNMDNNGLQLAGYLPFKQLNIIYKKVFSNPEPIIKKLAAGISPPLLRKDPLLMVYVAFMDINRIYQPRFLWNISFSIYTKWESSFNSDKLNLDNKNLQLGLDCLRVKEYGRAEELLLKECHHKSSKRFYATVGLAFLALERTRMADMRNHLEVAVSLATQEKERLYAALLLSKLYDLSNETWKARDLIKNAVTIKGDCQEILYRKVQLEVKGRFEENAFQMLRSLMMDERQFYMTVLMDPSLAPIQTKVEDILSAQYQTLLYSSQDNLAQAKHEINELSLWFDSSDQQMQANLQTLENLEKSFAQKSYFDVLDVAAKSKALQAASRLLRENKLNELYDQANRAQAKWNGYYHFWMSYRFPSFFKNFHNQLMPIKKKINQVKELAKKNLGKPYRQAVQLLDEVNTALKNIGPIYQRMNLVNLFCSAALIFCQKLFIVEIVLAVGAVGIVVTLASLPLNSSLSSLATLTSDPWFQKKAGICITLLIAPFIALMLTMQRMTK